MRINVLRMVSALCACILLSACSDGSNDVLVIDDPREPPDCSYSASPWVGVPCGQDSDCAYAGGTCLRDVAGFPCGTCSMSCESLCPDRTSFPVTFCVDGLEIGVQEGGACLSKCDPRFTGNGGSACRDGYTCKYLQRNAVREVGAGVCVPGAEPATVTGCRAQLAQSGLVFTAVDFTATSPVGYPALTCDIIDPVLLYSPVDGVPMLHYQTLEVEPALASCAMAQATQSMVAIARSLGATEIAYTRFYQCDLINDTEALSMHGRGEAVDLLAVRLEDGSVLTVARDWERDTLDPATPGGAWLRRFTDTLWREQVFSVILTPDFNEDHADHFHLDLSPDTLFYQ